MLSSPEVDQPPLLSVPIRRADFMTEWLGWAILASALAVGLLPPAEDATSFALRYGAPALVLFVLAGLRWWTRPQVAAPLIFYPDFMRLPRRAGGERTETVSYRQLTSFYATPGRKTADIVIGTSKGKFSYPVQALVDARRDGPKIPALLMDRVLRQPHGADQWAKIMEKKRLADEALSRRPVLTLSLLATLAAIYAAQYILDAEYDPLRLIDLGANAHVLVKEGQWYRLVTGNLLHLGPIHIFFNGLGVVALGPTLEQLVGRHRYGLILILSGLGGSVASSLNAKGILSVGFSTALFGMLGALFVLNLRYYRSLPAGLKEPVRWWVLVLGSNMLIPIAVPQIDIAGHAGGFLAGALITWSLFRSPTFNIARPAGSGVRWGLGVLTAACLIGTGQGVIKAIAHAEGDAARVLDHFAQSPQANGTILNQLAWMLAIAPETSDARLALAGRLIDRALVLSPDVNELIDTRATVLYRLGAYDEAIDAESSVFHRSPEPIFAYQLSRFLEARERARGVRTRGGASPDDVSFTIESDGTVHQAVIAPQGEFPKGGTLFIRVEVRDQPRALLRVEVPPRPTEVFTIRLDAVLPFADEPPQLHISMIDATQCLDCRGWTYIHQNFDPYAFDWP